MKRFAAFMAHLTIENAMVTVNLLAAPVAVYSR
jgi:hypothetical protein